MAHESEQTDWPVEDIPAEHRLLMRVHRNWTEEDGELIPGAFRNNNRGMSTDWDKYSTPRDTRRRGRQTEDNYGVLSMNVGDVKGIPGQTVEHTPIPKNRAHTDVLGVKDEDPKVRLKFMRIYQWEIEL